MLLQGVAAYLCERLKTLYQMNMQNLTAPAWRQKSIERYQFDPLELMPEPTLTGETVMRIPTGEDMLFQVADKTCRGDPGETIEYVFHHCTHTNACL